MASSLDQKQMSLLTRLCDVLQNPRTESLLERLTRRSPTPDHPPVSTPTPQPPPTLLQRMNGSASSENSSPQLNPSEEGRSRKRMLSPTSSGFSGRTLMSRFLNPKRNRPSTPTSPRSYQSSPTLIS